ncbi:MAG: 3-hydroxybutyryl-CoA dehydrogenase [candidate division Zixibacteria bacterium]|jgi:3-hydroxybutyryl-CoA dehydrogenase|nr:3-hydroxybutyryl-CoA dehydrogenase [candidate division Zixibacteria bacterium]
MIARVGIVGFGQMGSGIGQVAAAAGYTVLACDISSEAVQRGLGYITRSLDRAIEKGKADQALKSKVLGNISLHTDPADLRQCDLICEAVVESLEAKKEVYLALDGICHDHTIFASNTSSLSISDMAAVTTRRDRFVGLHFFNPVPIMKLCEVVRTIDTSDATFEAAFAFAESVGKTCVTAKDSPGFVANVLLVPYLLDGIRQYERGLASREDIDNAMMLGCGHPMGPLTLTDFIGLDTILYIADIMFEEFKDSHYAAPPLLRRMVNAGYMGKKTGRGFYDYAKK